MRLFEEAKYIKSEIWILAFLLISSVLIQCADDKINDYHRSINNEMLIAFNVLQVATAETISAGFAFSKQNLPFDAILGDTLKLTWESFK